MKKIIFALFAAVALLAGCSKGLEQRVETLEKKVESIDQLKAVIDALNKKVYVTNMTTLEDAEGNVIGYRLDLTNNESITITNGQDGADGATGPQGPAGADGDSWFKSVKLSADGKYVVITLNDEEKTQYELPIYNANATTDEFNIEFEKVSFENLFKGDKVEIPFKIVGEVAAEDVEIRVYPADPSWTVEVLANALKVTVGDGQKGRIDVWAWNNATLAAKEVRAKTIDFSAGVLRVSNTDDKELTAVEQSFLVPVMYYTDEVYVDYTDLEGNVLSGEGKWFYTTDASSTKAFTSRDLTIMVTKNDTGAKREGYLEFRTAADQEPLYKIKLTQGSYEASLLEVNWVESFELYASAEATEATESYSNKSFSISLGTDPTKGLYVLEGLLYHDGYFYVGTTRCEKMGGKYYADLEGTTLKVYLDEDTDENGYYDYSTNVWEMTYDKEAKTLTANSDISLTNYGGSDYILKGWTAGEYVAPTITSIVGNWTVTYQKAAFSWSTNGFGDYVQATGTMTISESGTGYEVYFLGTSSSYKLEGVFESNVLTLTGKWCGTQIELTFSLIDGQLVSDDQFEVEMMAAHKNFVAVLNQ